MIKRPKKVERGQKNYLTNERYQDYSEQQFTTIYDYLDSNEEENEENIENIYKKNIYSTDETKVGIWIDGKPIYRKVIDIQSYPNATIVSMDIPDIPNVETLITCRAMSRATGESFPVPSYYGQGYSSTVYYDTILADFNENTITSIRLKTNSNRTTYTGFIILEYTKTTD